MSLLHRALSDIVHTFRKFVQHASGSMKVSTDAEEKELKDIAKELTENEKDIADITQKEEKLNVEYEALKKSIEEDSQESRQSGT